MAIRNIITEEDSTLRKKSRPIDTFDAKTKQLVEDLIETLKASPNGVGLAAPQVGVLRRVCVVDTGEKVLELINPVILSKKGKQETGEGCLSCPGKYGITRRPKKVKVRAYDRDGNEFTAEGEDLIAKAFCHEIDHLDGILFTDHVIRMLPEEELEEE
jgi:peptide deformylase